MSIAMPEQAPAPGQMAVAPTDQTTQPLTPQPDQAPEATGGAEQVQGATEQPEAASPQVSFEEFQRVQAELREREEMINEIKRIAEEQRQREQEQQYRDGLRTRLRSDVVKKIQNAESDDEITEAIYGFVDATLNEARQTYEGQMQQYHQSVEQALWTATKDGFADHLVRENNLPPSLKANLLAFDNQNTMALAATQMAEALRNVQQQQVQQQVAQQVQQQRDSGVFAMSGNAGPTPMPEIKPGSARELTPALAQILGIRRPQ